MVVMGPAGLRRRDADPAYCRATVCRPAGPDAGGYRPDHDRHRRVCPGGCFAFYTGMGVDGAGGAAVPLLGQHCIALPDCILRAGLGLAAALSGRSEEHPTELPPLTR